MPMVMTALFAASPCVELNEPTPGWKQVKLTGERPFLAAPSGVPQFRSGERVQLSEQETGLFRVGTRDHGSTVFEVEVGRGAKNVTVVFKDSLRGAKVDVTSFGMSIVHEQRVRGAAVSFSFGDTAVTRVWVRVHQHLREPPVLMAVRVDGSALPAELGLPGDFAALGSLYFFQSEAMQRVVLCDAPGRPLTVTRAALAKAVSPVLVMQSR